MRGGEVHDEYEDKQAIQKSANLAAMDCPVAERRLCKAEAISVIESAPLIGRI